MSIDTSEGHPAMDYKEHERTYKGFIAAVKICTIGTVLVLVLMAAFLV